MTPDRNDPIANRLWRHNLRKLRIEESGVFVLNFTLIGFVIAAILTYAVKTTAPTIIVAFVITFVLHLILRKVCKIR